MEPVPHILRAEEEGAVHEGGSVLDSAVVAPGVAYHRRVDDTQPAVARGHDYSGVPKGDRANLVLVEVVGRTQMDRRVVGTASDDCRNRVQVRTAMGRERARRQA